MGRAKKAVLAYSGGVDTSVCIPYLKQEWGVEEVITFAADLGQGDELEPIRQKALDSGASQSIVGDLIEPFITEFAFPAIRANALYEGRYPLSTALARPLIARRLVEIAREVGADAVAHGCTGKGNDQVRFDVAIGALAPDLKVLTPAREWGMSREETIAYGERCGIPSPVSKKSPFSIDLNLLGRSIEAGPLEDPNVEPPEEIYAMTVSVDAAPDQAQTVEIGFEQGNPVSLDGVRLDPPGNGQWIYAFYPSPVRGSSFRDQRPLIDIGVLKSERLVNMANHNYSKDTGVEPNLTFTRDGKWLIFSGNFHTNPGHGHKATTHTYAVEIAKK